MGILRSEEMGHGLVVLPTERARAVLDKLGHAAPMEFQDANEGSQSRPYKKNLARVDASIKQAKTILAEVEKLSPDCITRSRTENFLERDANGENKSFEELEASIGKLSAQFGFFKKNNDVLHNEIAIATEEKYVCRLAKRTLAEVMPASGGGLNEPLLKGDNEMSFANVAGVCKSIDGERITRTVFRASRGNTYTVVEPIEEELYDPKEDKLVRKSVFVVYFQGAAGTAMLEKVTRTLSAYGVSLYAFPTNQQDATRRCVAAEEAIDNKQSVAEAYKRNMAADVKMLSAKVSEGGNSYIEEVVMSLEKERSIYHSLNMFEGSGTTIRTTCWFRASEEDAIRQALLEEGAGKEGGPGVLVKSNGLPGVPPTYIRRNEFTAATQELIDTYGAPGYQEANPALLSVITFPFIFGIMYGDVFHGGCLLLFGIWAIMNADKLRYGSDSAKQLYFARYMLFFMGFFAVYAGLMYNDFLSLGVDLFPSKWHVVSNDGKEVMLDASYDITNSGGEGPYPFGLDPAWHGATNELLFVNSLKMKLAVCMGVIQMLVGVFLRFSNAIHFRSTTDFICECCPMLIFMVCFFGYMDWMILYKWVTPTTTNPSLINSMISMGLGQTDKNPLYDGQVGVQGVLMTLIVASVPWLLIPKPVVLYLQHASKGNKVAADEECQGGGHGHGEFDLADIVIHQVIETIEYVLGTVSHTASYLRMWALSLAHQQLSVVFFTKTMVMAFNSGNPLAVYFLFGAFLMVTAGVLLGMDVLECFLHTLRLHWVEFQSKFYKADGRVFAPFHHEATLKEF